MNPAYSAPYYSQGNALFEQINETLEDNLAKICEGN